MGTIQIKRIKGHEYGYEFFSYWDKKEKKSKKKCKYLGKVVDKNNKIFEKYTPKSREKLLLTFGDTYSILEYLKTTPYYELLKKIFKKDFDFLISLILYKMLNVNSMKYADTWFEGNYISEVFPNLNISSQRISDFLKIISKEKTHRLFFAEYLKLFNGKISTLVDSTGLPNEIDFNLRAWSNHSGDIKQETRLLYVIDRNTGLPVYFRYMAGNIVDVTTLTNTIEELKQYGVQIDYAIVDAGYVSEENIKMLYSESTPFLTRLPSNRKLYSELINEYGKNIEKTGKITVYGERILYIKKVKTKLFGNKGYAYIIYDVKRYADEASKFIISAKEDKKSEDEIKTELHNKGKLIMISSEDIDENEIIPLYYTRQRVENVFGVMKSELNILPLRVHGVETFRGYIFLNFIALIIELSIQQKLHSKFTLDEVFLTTRNVICKVFDNNIIINEFNKKTKQIFEVLGIEPIKKLPRKKLGS